MSRGHYRAYIRKDFRQDTLDLIGAVNAIIEDYGRKGIHNLSVRQIYYQFVSQDLLPNTQASYNKIGNVISDGRLAGLISWTAIEDRNRTLKGLNTFENIAAVLKATKASYRIDKWRDQPWRPEVWVEKAALEGVVGSICNKLQVDFLALRGYNSQSEQWAAGQRFASYLAKGQRPIVFHLGDHDPSGLDMTRDNRERLEMFAGTPVLVQRLALNMAQIEQYDPPPNPAKQTDSRFEKYQQEYDTDESWELDALDPLVIRELISSAVLKIRDPDIWDAAVAREVDDMRELNDIISQVGGSTDDEDEEDDDGA